MVRDFIIKEPKYTFYRVGAEIEKKDAVMAKNRTNICTLKPESQIFLDLVLAKL